MSDENTSFEKWWADNSKLRDPHYQSLCAWKTSAAHSAARIADLEGQVAATQEMIQRAFEMSPVEHIPHPDGTGIMIVHSILREQLELPDATAQTARVQEEVLKEYLPLTADGKPIYPDMHVFCVVGDYIDERKVLGPYGKKALLTFEPARHGFGAGSCHRLADTVYSTREAAELRNSANQAEGKGEK